MGTRGRAALVVGLFAVAAGIALLVTQVREPALRNPLGNFAAGGEIYANRQAALRSRIVEPEFRAAFKAGRIVPGDPVARLVIPRLAVDLIVVEGVSGESLRAGAGHYPDSALPGEKNNVAIAGHRTGFGQAFQNLHLLKPRDRITLSTPAGRYTYELQPPFDGHTNPWVTDPLDWGVIGPTESAVVTLTTTDPPHTSKNRLIARFVLVKSEPSP